MKIEGRRYRLWIDPRISRDELGEAAHELFRHLTAPPRESAESRRVVVLALLNLLAGTRSARAKLLAAGYKSYLGLAWRLERDLDELPDPRTPQHVLLWKLAKINRGASLGWRRIYDISSMC